MFDKAWLAVGNKFFPKVLDEVEVRALCRPVKLFRTKVGQSFLYRRGIVHQGITGAPFDGKGPFTSHKVCAEAFPFSLIGTQVPSHVVYM